MEEISIYCPELNDLDISSSDYLIKYIQLGNPATYFTPEKDMNTIQCFGGKRRSLIDLYFLLKTKYPEYSFTQLGWDILSAVQAFRSGTNWSMGFKIFFCNDIKRIVLSPNYRYMPSEWVSNSLLEFEQTLGKVNIDGYDSLVLGLISILRGEDPEEALGLKKSIIIPTPFEELTLTK